MGAVIALDLPAILCLLGVAQGLLLSAVLLTSRHGNRTANRILAAIAMLISVSVAATILNYARYYQTYPHLIRAVHPLIFLAPPLIYLYVKALTFRSGLGKRDLLHFLPAVLCAIYLVPFYMSDPEYKIAAQSSSGWYYVRSALVILQFLIYLVLTTMLVTRHSRSNGTNLASADRSEIYTLLISIFALWIVGSVRYAVDLVFPDYMRATALVVPLGATAVVYILAYVRLRSTGGERPAPEKKYEKSTLTPESSARYLERLRHAMEHDKVYTDGELTLQKLSAKLSIPVQHLSQVVNEQLDQNILDFINMHRIEEVKRQLADPARKHLSILAIAEEAGFNSKSSFNAVFKKYTHQTPSEFRRSAPNPG